METATTELTAVLKHSPSDAELANKLGIDMRTWQRWNRELHNLGPVSTSMLADKHDDLKTIDFPCNSDMNPDSICARVEMSGALAEAVKGLSPRYRQVILMYYGSEMTMKAIGQALGVNESRVSQIHKAGLEKMADLLQSTGVESIQAFV